MQSNLSLKEFLECLYVRGIDRLNLTQINTIAKHVCNSSPTFKEFWNKASDLSVKQVDDIDSLSTCFYFKDGSSLKVSGFDFEVYDE